MNYQALSLLIVAVALIGCGAATQVETTRVLNEQSADATAMDNAKDSDMVVGETVAPAPAADPGSAKTDLPAPKPSTPSRADPTPEETPLASQPTPSSTPVVQQPDSNSGVDSCANYTDPCPVANGITWQCKKRFVQGTNYAWHNFAGDFGGISAWSINGVATSPDLEAEFADMAANGVKVIRWWIMPDFRGDGVVFDGSDTATGLGGTFVNDIRAALDLAAKYDVYLILDIFSFDNFRPTAMNSGLKVRGIQPMILDATKRTALLEKVIRPMAKAVEASPQRRRMMAWDVVNEPEWAMTGPSKYGDPDFECDPNYQCLTHSEMESFLADTIAVLRSESHALVTVGGAAVKWSQAWTHLDLDFYQFHTYDWVETWFPHTKTPTEYGVGSKPVLMGEYPVNGLTGVTVPNLLTSYLGNGYAGGLAWSVTDQSFDWNAGKGDLKSFTNAHSCQVSF